MASPGSLEVQCAIDCTTEALLKTCFGLCEPFTVRSVGRKDKELGSLMADGWFSNQIGCCCTGAPLHPVCVQFSERKTTHPKVVLEHHAKAPLGFVPRFSCLLDRRFNQLSHGANLNSRSMGGRLKGSNHQVTS